MSDESKEYVVSAGKVHDLAKARVMGTDPIMRLPDDMFIILNSGNRATVDAIVADAEYSRALILIGSLFRKHGTFSMEVCSRQIRSIYGVQPR